MIRIAIASAAFDAIAATLPLGSVGFERERADSGMRLRCPQGRKHLPYTVDNIVTVVQLGAYLIGQASWGGSPMAYWMEIPHTWAMGKTGLIPVFAPLYNLDSAVGVNAANRFDDVMLVQYLLRMWARLEKAADPTLKTKLKTGLYPTFQDCLPGVDGHCDSVTKTWITMFQMCHNRFIQNIDGRVDPLQPSNSPNNPNTILLLNLAKDEGIRPDAPAALVQAVRTIRH
jgi:hypothetical protein